MKQSKQILSLSIIVLLIGYYLVPALTAPKPVHAAQAGDSYMRLSRMKAATDPGNILVVFTTSSETQSENNISITLDSEYVSDTNFDSTAGNITTTETGIPGSSTAIGITGDVASSVASNTIEFALDAALSPSTEYAFIITAGIDLNPSASTTIIHTVFTETAGDAVIDTIDLAVPVISDDQIVITAAVPPSFTFVFDGNTDDLGTMSPSAVSSGSGNTITITTNAANGWYAWGLSANTSLDSAVQSYAIETAGSIDGSPSTLSSGTEGYVLDVDLTTDAASGGTVSIAGEYDGGDTSSGGTLSTSFQQLASANGTANGDEITLIPRAAIAGMTPASNDYTDTLTVVGAGIF